MSCTRHATARLLLPQLGISKEMEANNNTGVLKPEMKAVETGMSKMGISMSGQGGLNVEGARAIDDQEENSDLDFPDSGDEEEDEETALLREEVCVTFSRDGQLCRIVAIFAVNHVQFPNGLEGMYETLRAQLSLSRV